MAVSFVISSVSVCMELNQLIITGIKLSTPSGGLFGYTFCCTVFAKNKPGNKVREFWRISISHPE
jgi:hypothetical protein